MTPDQFCRFMGELSRKASNFFLRSIIFYSIKMAKLKLDLHEICKKGQLIENELKRIITEAVEKRIAIVEIIPGKGSGQLKKPSYGFSTGLR